MTASERDPRPLPDLLDDLAAAHSASSSPTVIAGALEDMVLHPEYPCLGARSVFNRDRATVVVLEALGSRESAGALRGALTAFGRHTDRSAGFASLVAVFRATEVADEVDFENLLWQQLRHLHAADQQ